MIFIFHLHNGMPFNHWKDANPPLPFLRCLKSLRGRLQWNVCHSHKCHVSLQCMSGMNLKQVACHILHAVIKTKGFVTIFAYSDMSVKMSFNLTCIRWVFFTFHFKKGYFPLSPPLWTPPRYSGFKKLSAFMKHPLSPYLCTAAPRNSGARATHAERGTNSTQCWGNSVENASASLRTLHFGLWKGHAGPRLALRKSRQAENF